MPLGADHLHTVNFSSRQTSTDAGKLCASGNGRLLKLLLQLAHWALFWTPNSITMLKNHDCQCMYAKLVGVGVCTRREVKGKG